MGTMLRVAIVAIIGAIWNNAITGPALVYSEEVSEKSQMKIHEKVTTDLTRDMVELNDFPGQTVCHPTEACGWVVYYAPDRYSISTIMKSTCVCKDSSYKCVRRRENLAISAFEYKCVQNPTEHDLILPADAI